MNDALLRQCFLENFTKRGEIGASFAIWDGNGPLLSLHHGRKSTRPDAAEWSAETLTLIWSATKGLVSTLLLSELFLRGIALETPISEVWPAFSQKGKDKITFSMLLSHRAGLFALEDPAPPMNDSDAVLSALELQKPLFLEPSRPAYHARTFGHLVDGCIRALSGRTVQQRWVEVFQQPLGLELYLGLPQEKLEHFAQPVQPRANSSDPFDQTFYKALSQHASPTARAFRSPGGFSTPSALSQPKALAAGFPSLGGVGTADALAKFYAMLANDGKWNGQEFFNRPFLLEATRPRATGLDAVLCRPTTFCTGFMLETPSQIPRLFDGFTEAFGQPGAGGVHAFALPREGLGVAYTMNAMGAGVMPNERALSLVNALKSALTGM